MDIPYLGSALKISRGLRKMTQLSVATFLTIELERQIALHDIQNIENNAYSITPALLAACCKIFNLPEVAIRKIAQELEQSSEKSDKEIIEEMQQEHEFWEFEQEQEDEE